MTNVNKTIIGVAIGAIILFLIIGFTIGKYHPDPNSQAVQDIVNKQLAEDKAAYEQTIKEKNAQLDDLSKQLINSNKIIYIYREQLNNLNVKVANIKPPKTMTEAKTRLRGMKYEVK